ncbi:MAG: hypothetical protein LBT46_00095 [Planctomycetaceae bacterium]|jgi:hypothetical protein|nr:hypothetical protein [Planctomycetaceae bacterium]
MTPFIALYHKERREHGWSLLTVFLTLCILLISSYGPLEIPRLSFALIWTLYITATAAMSYAKEDEEKTAMFLRMLPISGNTLLCAKLAWLGTAAACLTVPFGMMFGVMFYQNGNIDIWYSPVLALLFLLPWSLFWTTRISNKLLAFSAAIACGCGVPALTRLLSTTVMMVMMGIFDFESDLDYILTSFLSVIDTGILLWVGAVGLRRAARYYQLPEQIPSSIFRMNRNTGNADWLVRCFPQGRWSPFTAMLWQSITQSKDILTFGLLCGILFCGWEILLGQFFIAPLTTGTVFHNYFNNVLRTGSFLMFLFLIMSALGFVSVIFSRDQEGQRYRLFIQRGISHRLVWQSRILPFAAVYLFPLPFYIHYWNTLIQPSAADDVSAPKTAVILVVVLVYLLPFAIGSFFSILCKTVLMSAALTFGTFLVIFCTVFGNAVNSYGYHVGLENTLIPGSIILLGFLLASRLVVAGWLTTHR